MLPNKIYAGFDENTHLESYCTEKKGKCQMEYIRKDALLEWAKERREAVAKEVVIREGVRLGADAAFEELIDILNKM